MKKGCGKSLTFINKESETGMQSSNSNLICCIHISITALEKAMN